jgi:hypothetical protein
MPLIEPTCPHCKKRIGYKGKEQNGHARTLDYTIITTEIEGEVDIFTFCCPHCDSVLAILPAKTLI